MDSTILLVGNPNTGKTTLFNQLTGLHQKTGNFSGVTVEKKSGILKQNDHKIEIIDLPGTYGLGGNTEDKKLAYESILQRKPTDLVLYVLDGLNIERGFPFLLQIMDMGAPLAVVITMKDVLQKKRIKLHLEKMRKKTGVPFFLLNAKSGDGITELKSFLLEKERFSVGRRLWRWKKKEESWLEKTKAQLSFSDSGNDFFLQQAIKFFNKDPHSQDTRYSDSFPKETQNFLEAGLQKGKLAFSYEEELIQKSIYIKTFLSETVHESEQKVFSLQNRLDSLFLHPYWGFLFFFGCMALLFQSLFFFAEIPMDLIESTIQILQATVLELLPAGLLSSLLANGILGGVGSVVTFLPQIIFLFFFVGILEESGYLARVSLLMDKLMGKFGLSGRSFIPLLSSAACAVPAILGTRTIENKTDRLVTILVSPLIMCSARYPVYILIVGTVFDFEPAFGFFRIQGLVLFLMFLLGMFTSLLFALVFRKFLFKNQISFFVMELPEYHIPSFRSLFYTVIGKAKSFLTTAGQVILYISILLWFLSNFPTKQNSNLIQTNSIESSYIGTFGKKIEPYLQPMGFDWKMGVSIITSFAAREVMVSTLAVLYGADGETEESETLREKMLSDKKADGTPVWTPLVGMSLLVFFAFASQCMSTLAVTYKETGSAVWVVVQFTYMTSLAILSSVLVFQLGKALGF